MFLGLSYSLMDVMADGRGGSQRAAAQAVCQLARQIELVASNPHVCALLGLSGPPAAIPTGACLITDVGLLRGGWLGDMVRAPSPATLARARQAMGEHSLTAALDQLVCRAGDGDSQAREAVVLLVRELLGEAGDRPILRAACRRRQLAVHPDKQQDLSEADAAVATEASRLLGHAGALLAGDLGAQLFAGSVCSPPPTRPRNREVGLAPLGRIGWQP